MKKLKVTRVTGAALTSFSFHPHTFQPHKTIAKKEAQRQKKILNLYKCAETDYPYLHKVIASKATKSEIGKLPLAALSKMAYRLGLKRKKEGASAPFSFPCDPFIFLFTRQMILSNKEPSLAIA